MDAKEIKKRLIEMELTQTKLAFEIGVSVQAVSMFINGRIRSRKIRDYLEARLGFRQPKAKKA